MYNKYIRHEIILGNAPNPNNPKISNSNIPPNSHLISRVYNATFSADYSIAKIFNSNRPPVQYNVSIRRIKYQTIIFDFNMPRIQYNAVIIS